MRKFNAEMTVLSIRRRSATAIWEFTIGNGSLFDADYRYFADCRRIADDRWEAWGGGSGYLSSVHQQLYRSGEKLVNFTEQFQNGYSGYERFLKL